METFSLNYLFKNFSLQNFFVICVLICIFLLFMLKIFFLQLLTLGSNGNVFLLQIICFLLLQLIILPEVHLGYAD